LSKKQAKTKTQNQKAHAKDAFKERFGEDMNKERYNQFVGYIQKLTNTDNVKVTFLKKSTNRVSAYLIEEDGKEYKCLYDKQRKTIK
jgi:hypothetical protein